MTHQRPNLLPIPWCAQPKELRHILLIRNLSWPSTSCKVVRILASAGLFDSNIYIDEVLRSVSVLALTRINPRPRKLVPTGGSVHNQDRLASSPVEKMTLAPIFYHLSLFGAFCTDLLISRLTSFLAAVATCWAALLVLLAATLTPCSSASTELLLPPEDSFSCPPVSWDVPFDDWDPFLEVLWEAWEFWLETVVPAAPLLFLKAATAWAPVSSARVLIVLRSTRGISSYAGISSTAILAAL